jgi:hypothetical protein
MGHQYDMVVSPWLQPLALGLKPMYSIGNKGLNKRIAGTRPRFQEEIIPQNLNG